MLFMSYLSEPEADSSNMASPTARTMIERFFERYLMLLIAGISISLAFMRGLSGPYKYGVDWGIPDMNFFSGPAVSLTRGDLDAVYASWTNQAAPLYLLFLGLVIRAARLFDSPTIWVLWQALLNFVLLCTAAVFAKRLAKELVPLSCWGPWVPVLSVATLILFDIPHFYYQQGHWAHIPVLIFWVLMALLIQRDNTKDAALAGLAFGLSIAWEPLGPLGLAALLLAPRILRALQAIGVATIVSGIAWLPFKFSGNFHMGEVRWWIHENTVWDYLGFQDIPWSIRFVQGLLVLTSAGIAIWALRKKGVNAFLVSVSSASIIFATRIAWDNIFVSYYLIVLLVTAAATIPVLNLLRDWKRVVFLSVASAGAPVAALSLPAPLVFLLMTAAWTHTGLSAGRYLE